MDMPAGAFFPRPVEIHNLVLASFFPSVRVGDDGHSRDGREESVAQLPQGPIIIGSLLSRSASSCWAPSSLGFIIPAKDISLTQSLLVRIRQLFPTYLHISWAGPIIAIALMFGVLAC